MDEGAKMAGASQGTAQQRAFTQERAKGGRKGCTDREMVDLSFYYKHTQHTTHTQSLKHKRMYACSPHARNYTVIEDMINCLQSK